MLSRALLFVPLGFCMSLCVHAMSILPDFLRQKPPEVSEKERVDFDFALADKVVVKKAERRIYLMKGEEPARSYPISLGFAPKGHKERQGDGRTPEGRYRLDWRNAKSKFYKALHISYPSARDRKRAKRHRIDPGGMIMIHGQPRPNRRYADLQQLVATEDWTQGCIAVSNEAVNEIWAKTRDGTPIEILP